MNECDDSRVIVCAGAKVSLACSQAMAWLEARKSDKCQFVMREWIDEEQFRRAVLLWVVDDSVPWNAVHFALRNWIPLLVHENNVPIKQLCITAACGLFYDRDVEAASCVELLLTSERTRRRLGENGFLYLTR